MDAVRFSADDAVAAQETWGANCGPGALAALLDMTLAEIRPHLGDFESKHYMNPTMMWAALRSVGAKFVRAPTDWPKHGLARVQWDGPWCNEGVPMAVRYRYTHWVAVKRVEHPLSISVFDINAISAGGWIPLQEWGDSLVPRLLKHVAPRASGRWWLTHVVEVEPRNG